MSESFGLEIVNRVQKRDRLPFVKALAHIAAVDNSIDLHEKEIVQDYSEAWELNDDEKARVRSILNADQEIALADLSEEFSESGTRFLLMQELMRISYADGEYVDVERKEIAAIAQRLDMSEQQFREVEKWVGRGQSWKDHAPDGPEDGEKELQDILAQEEEDEEEGYDLSDIETSDSDLGEIEPGGYEIDEEELDEILEEEGIEGEEAEGEEEADPAEKEAEASDAEEEDAEDDDDEEAKNTNTGESENSEEDENLANSASS